MTDRFYKTIKKPILIKGVLEAVLKLILTVLSLLVLFVPLFKLTADGEEILSVSCINYISNFFSITRFVENGLPLGIDLFLIFFGIGMIISSCYYLFETVIAFSALMNQRLYVSYVFYAYSSQETRCLTRHKRLINECKICTAWLVVLWITTLSAFLVLFFDEESSVQITFNMMGFLLPLALLIASFVLTAYIKESHESISTITEGKTKQTEEEGGSHETIS